MKDMTPPGERSIRNIPVSGGSHRRSNPERFPGDIPLPKRRKRSRRWLWITVAVVVVCAIAGLLLSTLFAGATVTITPKMQSVNPPANLTAAPNAPSGSLGYQTVSLSQSATTAVSASGTQHISKQASGAVTISNTFSAAPQALIANTRFAAADGKIYRIHSAVTVPGGKKKADGTFTAGTVVATIYADAPGADYNRTGPTSFTIPGFKGDARYTKITAQSTADITGGFVGDQAGITDADMQKAEDTLKSQLDAALSSASGNSVPENFLPVQGSLAITYSAIAQSPVDGGKVSLTQTANATLAIVKSADLASALAKLLVQGYAGENVDFATPNPLILQLATSTSKTPVNTGPLTLLLQGSPTLVWQFDQDALKTALLGKDKSAFQSVVQQFSPAIEKAQASIRPFWKTTFPTDSSKLQVTVDAE